MKSTVSFFLSAPGMLIRALLQGYRLGISPLFPPACRHLPTCSEYALIALRDHGALRGSWLTLRRLARCHPWGTEGFDPPPLPTGTKYPPRS